MSDQKTCPACRVRSIEYPTAGGIVEDRSCTGRAGCVQHPGRENPTPDSAPAGADVPVGKADIVERLRDGAILHPRRWSGDCHSDLGGSVDEAATDALMSEAAAEIARLRAEVERLKAEAFDAWGRKEAALADRAAIAQRVAEGERDEARRLLEEAKTLIGTLQWSLEWEKEGRRKDRAQAEADRAALATRAAEAVREAVASEFDRRADVVEKLEAQLLQANEPVHRDTVRNLQRYAQVARWVDIGPILAKVLKEGAP